MSGFTPQSVLNAVLSDKKEKQSASYGVFYDEMQDLKVEDRFDSCEHNGPDPPINVMEDEKKLEKYTTLQLGEREIDINVMDYGLFLPGYTITIYGPRRSGKTQFIKALCSQIRPWYPEVICFTRTKASCEYNLFLPDSCIIDHLDEQLLLNVIKGQQSKKIAQSNGKEVGNYNLLVILDDCMSEKLRYKDIFNKLFFEGRHFNISVIVSLQDAKGIAPAACVNTDMCVTFPLHDRRSRDALRERFCDYLSREELDHLFEDPSINKKFHLLAFTISRRYNDINSRIYFGCVDTDNIPKFVMGDKALWENDKQQLIDLGFEHLCYTTDWGIIQ